MVGAKHRGFVGVGRLGLAIQLQSGSHQGPVTIDNTWATSYPSRQVRPQNTRSHEHERGDQILSHGDLRLLSNSVHQSTLPASEGRFPERSVARRTRRIASTIPRG